MWKKSGTQLGREGPPGPPGRAWGRRAGEMGPVGVESRAWQAGAPVFEQQDPEQIFSVLRLDLPLEDKPVQQLAGHPGQGFLWQVQEDSTCRQGRGEQAGWPWPSSSLSASHAGVTRRGAQRGSLTLGKGFLQLQEAPEGEVRQVWAAPDPVLPQVLL